MKSNGKQYHLQLAVTMGPAASCYIETRNGLHGRAGEPRF